MKASRLQDLLTAIDRCDFAKVRQLVESGLSVNQRTEAGCTPLMFSVIPNPFDDPTGAEWIEKIVDCLLALGADKTLKDNEGMMAADYLRQQLDPDWKSEYGFDGPAKYWSENDIAVLQRIESKLK